MSRPRQAMPAKLLTGMFMRRKRLFEEAAAALADACGDIDIVGPWMPFDYTGYYEREMGAPLFRRLIAFKQLIGQDDLAAVKLATNALEERFQLEGKRRINIDPGYLLLERFVLASGKNFSHRIYIGSGIYADLTLVYRHGAYRALPWTYPDYADAPIKGFLAQVRAKYALDLKR